MEAITSMTRMEDEQIRIHQYIHGFSNEVYLTEKQILELVDFAAKTMIFKLTDTPL
jgi:hypothetical protein